MLTWLGSASSTANTAAYNFGSFVAPTAGLMLVLSTIRGDTSGTHLSVSIGGTAGTLHFNAPALLNKKAIASRVVAAGSNNVTVTLSAANGVNTGAAVGVWLLTGYTSITPSSPADESATSNTWTRTMTIPARRVATYAHQHGFSVTGAVTWSDALERTDFLATCRYSHADLRGVTGSHTETVSRAGGSDFGYILGAAWG
ncbi:hypothetical protein VW23_009940 [Devosia insulae DS-56]|uniref:Uncharacterized protein n=1 Tax=Devosia insulae DS-56 TaxID=1116389 RepID=A0A1E5XVY6_9HYPH|nr:hypothetical protein VW23_009940 [Devosia insulae DS-56]